jgi:hypothetical protein
MSNVAGKAYAMNVITPMPRWLTPVQRIIFQASRCFPSALDSLLGLGLIHFARWVIVKRDQWPASRLGKPQLNYDYMIFVSNFNGTWDQYIDAFSDGIPKGLDLSWYASHKFPQSIPITPFKQYIVYNQFDTNYYYNATPGAAQRDIKAALFLLGQIRALAASHPGQSPAEFAAAFRQTLVRVQNCLGSHGIGPTASLVTQQVEEIRRTGKIQTR